MTNQDLNSKEYNAYYQPYIDKAGTGDIFDHLRSNHKTIMSFFRNIDVEKHGYRYEDGKWSIKEILLHLIDTERIFAYRALRIARNDHTILPGFDQDVYVAQSQAELRTMDSLLSEYESVRTSTRSLFENLDPNALTNIGIASNSNLSVRAAAFIVIGHENHHLQIIKERYL